MKKIIFIVITFGVIFGLLNSCAKTPAENITTATEKMTSELDTTNFETILSTAVTQEDAPPQYVEPGSIKLYEDPKNDFAGGEWPNWTPSYRRVYYGVSSKLIEFVASQAGVDYSSVTEYIASSRGDINTEKHEMSVISVIKHYNVTREDFIKAIKEEIEAYNELGGRDMTSEEYEQPNADIIYTFNDEKINEYYSRDLKKAQAAYEWLQEWLKTNKPYNSYSEYLAANKK